jgi:hypothetical protein
MFNFHLARDKVTEKLHIAERALLPTFLNRLAAVRLKIEQERLEEFLVKQVTRVVPVTVRERYSDHSPRARIPGRLTSSRKLPVRFNDL